MGDSDGVGTGPGSKFDQFGIGTNCFILKWSRNRSRSQNARVESKSESEPGPSGTAHLWSGVLYNV